MVLVLMAMPTLVGQPGTVAIVLLATGMCFKDRQRICIVLSPNHRLCYSGWNSSRSDYGRGGYGRGGGFYERGSYGAGNYRNRREEGGYQRRDESRGYWKDGVHHVGASNPRAERELFGTADDSDRQQTGINFEKYDDIPVEASGHDCPEAVTVVCIPFIIIVSHFFYLYIIFA